MKSCKKKRRNWRHRVGGFTFTDLHLILYSTSKACDDSQQTEISKDSTPFSRPSRYGTSNPSLYLLKKINKNFNTISLRTTHKKVAKSSVQCTIALNIHVFFIKVQTYDVLINCYTKFMKKYKVSVRDRYGISDKKLIIRHNFMQQIGQVRYRQVRYPFNVNTYHIGHRTVINKIHKSKFFGLTEKNTIEFS